MSKFLTHIHILIEFEYVEPDLKFYNVIALLIQL